MSYYPDYKPFGIYNKKIKNSVPYPLSSSSSSSPLLLSSTTMAFRPKSYVTSAIKPSSNTSRFLQKQRCLRPLKKTSIIPITSYTRSNPKSINISDIETSLQKYRDRQSPDLKSVPRALPWPLNRTQGTIKRGRTVLRLHTIHKNNCKSVVVATPLSLSLSSPVSEFDEATSAQQIHNSGQSSQSVSDQSVSESESQFLKTIRRNSAEISQEEVKFLDKVYFSKTGFYPCMSSDCFFKVF